MPQALRSPGTLVFATALALAGVVAGVSAPSRATGEEKKDDRKVHAAGGCTDTLAAPWRDVYRVAIAELEKNEWTIQRADTVQRRVVTKWKRMDHALAKFVFGDVQARCVVDVVPLDSGNTELTLRGGLVGPEDLDRTAAFGAARSAYGKAAARWMNRVRASLANELSAGTDPRGAR